MYVKRGGAESQLEVSFWVTQTLSAQARVEGGYDSRPEFIMTEQITTAFTAAMTQRHNGAKGYTTFGGMRVVNVDSNAPDESMRKFTTVKSNRQQSTTVQPDHSHHRKHGTPWWFTAAMAGVLVVLAGIILVGRDAQAEHQSQTAEGARPKPKAARKGRYSGSDGVPTAGRPSLTGTQPFDAPAEQTQCVNEESTYAAGEMKETRLQFTTTKEY